MRPASCDEATQADDLQAKRRPDDQCRPATVVPERKPPTVFRMQRGAWLQSVPNISVFGTSIFRETKERRYWVSEASFQGAPLEELSRIDLASRKRSSNAMVRSDRV
jgi:hypothetical protein